MQKALFQLESFRCPSCGKKIEDYFKNQKGIRSVQVLPRLSRVRMEFNDAQLKVETIEVMFYQLGYIVKSKKIVEGGK